MPLNPSGAISLAGPVAGQSIAVELGQSATATISLNDTNVRTLAQVPSGVIVMPTDFYGKSSFTATQRAIFAFGRVGTSPANPPGRLANSNLVSNTGVLAATTPIAGTARSGLGAAGYGGDKAICAYGDSPSLRNLSNLISNTGVVASDTPGVGTARVDLAAAGYGGDKAIFAFGENSSPGYTSISNLVSNTGVVASDTPGVGVTRRELAAAGYGGMNDKAIFAFGRQRIAPATSYTNRSSLVSNTGVFAADTPGVGTVRADLAAAGYGGDKAIFGFGSVPGAFYNITNLVSNTGVVASDTPGVGTARQNLGAAGYGGDKAIFALGSSPQIANPFAYNVSNLVSNTGVVASDTSTVGLKYSFGAAGYSYT